MAGWKKIIVSGSNAELNHITSSGNFEIVGNVSGSVTSTGSFGRVEATTLSGDGAGITGLTSAAIDSISNFGDNNRVLTAAGASAVNAEANLTFDSSTLNVAGAIASTGNITTEGDVIAQNYIVSSSVTYMTSSFSSGSTVFGNSSDDTHTFSGSVYVSGSIFPAGDDQFDLGSSALAWKDLYLEGDITLSDAGSLKTTAGNLTVDSEAATLVLDGHTGVDIDASNSDKVAIDGAGGIDIGVAADVAIDVDSSTFDLDASGAITIDGTSTIAIAGASTSTYGDDTAVWSFDGSGAVSETGMTTFDLTPSSTVDIDAGGAVTIDGTSITIGGDDSGVAISIGHTTSETTINDNLTIVGNLVVQGDTIQQQVANLSVEDRFILLNSGSASGDGGIVVQTESADGDGVAFGYDDNVSRWAFQQGTKLNATASAIAPDAYASAVVTSDDANYQKNGNIRVESGEIYIYVE